MDLFIIYPVPAMLYSTGQHCDSGASLHHVDLTGHPIGDEATIQTGRQVANRSPAGTRWPIGDGVLSRRVPGLQRGKSLKGLPCTQRLKVSARSCCEGLLNDRLVPQMVTAFLNIHGLLTK